ncbi:LLM class F420-dependent oxidoreductase [Mycobacterium sp. 852013-50091_SCH5140682]|uniref:LLM class F420-dependent oxidoreductase n=1 Tax=Mycobacterium sp. 852013-50091_SCH5140682 TaxID=1834109 RepID=UPI000A67AAD2|nr:LLM class F420-dependent oxidoreductase [Mycobacterium sp. 852013-50091_SCH5140682]
MKLGMPLRYYGSEFAAVVDRLPEFEQVGLDRVMIAEAYSVDAVSQMGYVAAKTCRAELAFGVLPMFSRTPTNLAMTAAGIDYVSGGRCILGIGASGPQVIEGFHGVKYDAPIERAREHVAICRKIWRREASEYRGKHYTLPLDVDSGGSGLGKPLKIIGTPVRARIPMALAAIGPENVELAAEIFDEWQPILFHPERADRAFGDALRAGKARRDGELDDLGISVQCPLLISDDSDRVTSALNAVRANVALYVGGMGAAGKNYYNALFARYGYPQQARQIQDLFLGGAKSAAAEAVPEEFARAISLIGSRAEVGDRLAALKDAGVTCVLADAVASSHAERIDAMATVKGFII